MLIYKRIKDFKERDKQILKKINEYINKNKSPTKTCKRQNMNTLSIRINFELVA
jgi:hypothetical protein